MKLNELLIELLIKGEERYSYVDVRDNLRDWKDAKYDKLIDAAIPGITLGVKASVRINSKQAYYVVLLDSSKPIGFVYFVEPREFDGAKKIPANTKTPHSGILRPYSGKGYISSVYRWFLDAGHNLMTGQEQTAASNMLWRSLSKHYPLQFIDSKGKVIRDITPEKAQERDTRMLLIGKGNKGLKEEQLQELAEKDVPYEVTTKSSRYFSTEGIAGGRKIKFTASYVMQEWEIEFSEMRDDDSRTYKATGSGAQFDVLSIIVRSLKEFITRYQPDSITFTAENGRRASIYKRAMSKYVHGFKEVDEDAHGYKLNHDAIRYVRK